MAEPLRITGNIVGIAAALIIGIGWIRGFSPTTPLWELQV